MPNTLITLTSPDQLRLAVRAWPGPAPGANVVLCLHGLTRNSRDFERVAEDLAGRCRVLAPDQRGRGRSDYDPDPGRYDIGAQVQDTWWLLDQLGVTTVVVIGVSMGALMAVAMANQKPERIAGMILDDAGPDIDPRGLARIAGYVGQGGPAASWADAAATLREVHVAAYPTYTDHDWRRMARATYVQSPDGLRPDYDAALGRAFDAASGAGPDMWPFFDVCSRIPTLVIRGALSDILARETADEMARRFGLEVVEVADRGHAPDLSEPEAAGAIQSFLTRGDVSARWTDPAATSPPAT
ncbi:alpha/beta hydrolase [Phenylobacterium sp. LjRoot225]|uniref:alpha/beta fold hydrolase n=1 Tax=Phenylobacterium sp. LjRoot225 TaxID=3342285 RepID=UPI003ED050D7